MADISKKIELLSQALETLKVQLNSPEVGPKLFELYEPVLTLFAANLSQIIKVAIALEIELNKDLIEGKNTKEDWPDTIPED